MLPKRRRNIVQSTVSLVLDFLVLGLAAGHFVGPVAMHRGRDAAGLHVVRGVGHIDRIGSAGGLAHGVVEELDAAVAGDEIHLVGRGDAGEVCATAGAVAAAMRVAGAVAFSSREETEGPGDVAGLKRDCRDGGEDQSHGEEEGV